MKNINSQKNRKSTRIFRVVKMIVAVIIFVAIPQVANAQHPALGGGAGTAGNPYLISTASHLEDLGTYVNSGNGTTTVNVYYRLNNDIDLSGYSNWKPIGIRPYANAFCGKFDGNNKVIKNLTINRPTESTVGLFGYTYCSGANNTASISNLGIENCNIIGVANVGGLAGESAWSSIANCYTTGSIKGSGENTGGLIGIDHSSTISNCYSIANVTGNTNVGGLFGKASYQTIIRNCFAANAFVASTSNVTSVDRLVGIFSAPFGTTLQNNYALNSTVVRNSNGNITITDGSNNAATSKDLNTLQSLAFYTTAGNWNGGAWNIASSSAGNTSAAWIICDGVYFPCLRQQGKDVCTPAIIAVAGINGSITPSGHVNIESGNNAVFNIVPDIYYGVDKILLDGADVSDKIVNNTYTVENVTKSHTLSVTFKLNIFCGGDGTQNDPYQICNAAGLKTFSEFVNAGNGNGTKSKYYKLMNDVDLSGYENWEPIGNNNTVDASTCFQGNFDGNDKIVQKLSINLPARNEIGLFGVITNNAVISNLGVENCNIKGGEYESVGGLVGTSSSGTAIINCYVTGIVSGGNIVGGLVGANRSAISYCYAAGNVSGQNEVGGLVGSCTGGSSGISHSYATCSVTGNDYVGGLAGNSASNALITQSYATGNVTASNYVGGLLGQNNNAAKVSNSYATGNVTGSDYVGGLVGYNLGNSFTSAQGVDVRSIISYCYATGIVKGSHCVGGLVGTNVSNGVSANPLIINNVAANPSITASETSYVNRIAGGNTGTLQDNYALSNMQVQSAGGVAGTSKTREELQMLTFYTTAGNWNSSGAWNMTSTWDICENKTLPWLRWQNVDCNNVGIFETRLSNIKIYPNPVDDVFIVECKELTPITIRLYDMLGKGVLTQTVSDKTEINVSHLSQGIYNISISSNGQIIGNSKIVKQ